MTPTRKSFLRVFILKISYLLWSILGVMLLTPSTAPEEHWVAMFFNNPRSAEFFDSYGLHPIVYGLTDFLDSHSSSWDYNSKTLQSLISEVCGHYTVYYILFRSRGCSLSEILTHFSNNVSLNNKTVEHFIQNLLKM